MEIGKLLLTIGVLFIVLGLVFTLLSSIGIPRLPGDIYIKRENFTFYFPWVTMLLISVVLTVIINLFLRR